MYFSTIPVTTDTLIVLEVSPQINENRIIPDLNLVFVLKGSGYGNEYVEGKQALNIFENYI